MSKFATFHPDLAVADGLLAAFAVALFAILFLGGHSPLPHVTGGSAVAIVVPTT